MLGDICSMFAGCNGSIRWSRLCSCCSDIAWTSKDRFYESCASGDLERAKQFLEPKSKEDKRAWVTWKNSDGSTALHAAAFSGNAELLDYLLACEGDVNAHGTSGETPIHTAARSGHPEMVLRLLDAGAEIDHQDTRGHSALHWTAVVNKPNVTKVLLERGAQPNLRTERGHTAFSQARVSGHTEVQQLIETAGGAV